MEGLPFDIGAPPVFTAFASFFYADDLGPPATTFTQVYAVEVMDTGPSGALRNPLLAVTFTLTVVAEAALNKSVVFVLDRTASMQSASSPGTRLDRLKSAVQRGLALFTQADNLGVVTLDHQTGAVLVPFGGGSTTLALAASATAALDVDQSFPPKKKYQLGIDLGRAQSSVATVLLVTDGICSRNGYPSAMPTSTTSALFIGTGSTLPDAALNNLHSSGGAYAIAAPDTGEFAIEKLFSQILIDLGGGTVVSDPDGTLGQHPQSFPLILNETDRELELIIFSNHPEWLQVKLDGPGLPGHPHTSSESYAHPEAGGSHQEKPLELPGVLVKRLRLGPLSQESTLMPSVQISRSKRAPDHAQPTFTFMAAVQSDLVLDARATASGFEVGADLLLSARLTEYGLPIQNRNGVEVEVELTHPDGGVETVRLSEHSPGHFEASRRTFRAGVFTVHFVAIGRTLLQHRPFRRESLKSVLILELGATRCCGPDAEDEPWSRC